MSQEGVATNVVVVGGGVSGLYCAWKLAQEKYQVTLLELSGRWGGRMETATMEGFVAEFGPMRFEPALQPKFAELVSKLDIQLVRFTGPGAPKIEMPKYDLKGQELRVSDANPLLMLRRGLLLIMDRKLDDDDPAGLADHHQNWINGLTEADYMKIRKEQTLPHDSSVKLWQVGLWNALAASGLSHQAVMLVRDVGTFYHMIPDNLNAAEWTIWWLRALKTVGQNLFTIEGGTELIGSRLIGLLKQFPNVAKRTGCEVLKLEASGNNMVTTTYRTSGSVSSLTSDHVILALPKAPLKTIAAASGSAFPDPVLKSLDAVDGFPLLKVFFVVSDPWWNANTPPHTRANYMPTRELHYQVLEYVNKGMVLIYTDRPATEYWKNYVTQNPHNIAEIDKNEVLKKEFGRWMAKEVMAALDGPAEMSGGLELTAEAVGRFSGLTEEEIASRIASSVLTYGIRDWSRWPYGGAFHSWIPGAKSWEVMPLLAGFGLNRATVSHVHVCGEAYSDYSGFIEGALRTADAALAQIL